MFNWKDYLDLALFLYGDDKIGYSEEAGHRAAISRAYYAAFCYTRNYAHDHSSFEPTGSAKDHGLLKAHYRKRGYYDIVNCLDELRQWRNNCDYDNEIECNLSQRVQYAIDDAKYIIEKMK